MQKMTFNLVYMSVCVLFWQLVSFLRHSEHIAECDKKKRFTEAYTVKMATYLIQQLQKENEKLTGGKKNYTNGGSTRAKKKKPSNAFIKFSSSFRPAFVHALKTAQAQANVRGENRLLIAMHVYTCSFYHYSGCMRWVYVHEYSDTQKEKATTQP